ncbi:MAG: zinc-ribbon domain-containing protein [Deltaproteobacteria bacterium]|nr:zinc-ribbon domain-containing protein [Deltaproteobacteria bacterium]
MKFSCDRCATRYSIGDDKVRGKILKIRCKTCGNIVVVREQTGAVQATAGVAASAGAAAPQPVASAGPAVLAPPRQTQEPRAQQARAQPPQAQRGAVDWYVAIKGKQHGPAKKDDVARLLREGSITERTYVWNEGMAAWARLRDVPELAMYIGAAPPAARPPPPPPDEGQGQGAEIIPFDEAKRARELQDAVREPMASNANDPFAAVAGASPIDPGAPRDSTRVFIMKAGLANRSTKHRAYAMGAGVAFVAFSALCVLDYQGVIEIPGLHRVVVAVSRPAAERRAIANNDWADAEEDPVLKCQLFPDRAKCESEVRAQNEVKRARRTKKSENLGGTGVAGMNLDDAFKTGGDTGGGLAAAPVTNTEFAGATLSAEERARMALLTKDTKKLTTPTARMDTPVVEAGTLDAKDVARVVGNGSGAIQDCIEQAAKTGEVPGGKQRLVLTVNPRGVVDRAVFQNGAVNASPAGECVTKAASRWKFTAFAGEATDVEIPLILSVN